MEVYDKWSRWELNPRLHTPRENNTAIIRDLMFPTGFEPVVSSRIRQSKGTYEETMSLRNFNNPLSSIVRLCGSN